ncbi:hypothetical protein C8R43DRAFT_1133938 [Mycena crocata]|nr:hypothetical protein C8R43DRAFT_1133938 [Mycena crocata]
MASGQLIPSERMWEGTLEVGGLMQTGIFEVFNSGGGWPFLFGKPLQSKFGAVHDYGCDVVQIAVEGVGVLLPNQCGPPWWTKFKPACMAGEPAAFTGVTSSASTPARRVHSYKMLMCDGFDKHQAPEPVRAVVMVEELAATTCIEEVLEDVKRQCTMMEEVEDTDELPSSLREERYVHPAEAESHVCNSLGARATPVRGVPNNVQNVHETNVEHKVLDRTEQSTRWAEKLPGSKEGSVEVEDGTPSMHEKSVGASTTPSRGVQNNPSIMLVDKTTDTDAPEGTYDTKLHVQPAEESVYTRASDPFNPARVAQILESVKIGPDLMEEQCLEVREMVAEYADIFALAVSEVFLVKGVVYSPKIPEGHQFSTKAEYLHQQVEVLEKAGIICPIHPRDVKKSMMGVDYPMTS